MKRVALAFICGALLAGCQTTQTALPAAPAAVSPPPSALDRSRNDANRDDVLKSVVSRRIAELDSRAYRAVTVESWQGRILLMGAVVKPEQRRKAEALAALQGGVTAVINELIVAEEKSLDQFIPDPAREQAVRLRLGVEGRAGTIVRVVNGAAYLLGGVAQPADAQALKDAAQDVDGIKWVVAHFQVITP